MIPDRLGILEQEVTRKAERIRAARHKLRELERLLGPSDVPGVSIFAPEAFPELPHVAGVRLATAAAGVRYKNRPDVMLAVADSGSTIAGAFTTSRMRSAPVLWCQDRITDHVAGKTPPGPIAILANSGRSNAFTGQSGQQSVESCVSAVATGIGTDRGNVFVASTGVIGEPLPHERITAQVANLIARLEPGNWLEANRSIMTTDSYPKGAGATISIDGVVINIAGFAKGAGMIAPDMATMLVFIFTDAAISPPALQSMVTSLVKSSFNAITVDGDTSTSDTLLVVATGKAGNLIITDPDDHRISTLRCALLDTMTSLSHQVVKDGEGATKFAEITVSGAKTPAAAKKIALSIANSPLVKTALAGEDPNWGRIVAAVGKAGEEADRDRLAIKFGDILVAENGQVSPGYREVDGAAYMKGSELKIAVDVGVGIGCSTVWTCDLTHEYISINADYRS